MAYREWDQGKDWNQGGDWNQRKPARGREEEDYYGNAEKRRRYNNVVGLDTAKSLLV
jgi:hypothetical protein